MIRATGNEVRGRGQRPTARRTAVFGGSPRVSLVHLFEGKPPVTPNHR